MKRLKYYLAGGLMITALAGFNSCKLESEVYTAITEDKIPQTEEGAEALVTANGYGAFRSAGYGGFLNVATGYMLISDLLSDYGECSWRQWDKLMYLQFTNSSTDNNTVNNLYGYTNFIGKARIAQAQIEKMDIDSEVKEQCIAELKCAQGWLAFMCYDLWGPIPIPTIEALQDPVSEQIFPRATEEEMQKFIVDNLSQAANVLPANYKKDDADYGKFTAGLCNTVLLKFYMLTKNWPEAERIGRELTKEGNPYGYELIPDYTDLFTLANEKHVETIWAINCMRGTQEHKWHPHVLPADYPGTGALTKWNGWKIAWDFFNKAYDQSKDKRLKTLIYDYEGVKFENGKEIPTGERHNFTNDRESTDKFLYYGAIPLKYDWEDFAGTMGENSETDQIIYRYADVLTLTAEAIVRNGNTVTQEALNLVNPIRTRAGLDKYQLSQFNSPQAFIDELLEERARELIYEGCRRQDLIRNGTYVEKMKAKAKYAGFTTLASENYYRLPLPQSLINEGKGAIKNNPGYN